MVLPPSLHLGLGLPSDEPRVDLLEELRVEDTLGGDLRGDPVERVEEVDELAHAAVDLVRHLHRIDVEDGGPSVGTGRWRTAPGVRAGRLAVPALRRPPADRGGAHGGRASSGLARAAWVRDRLAIRGAVALAAATGSVAEPDIPSRQSLAPDPDLSPSSASVFVLAFAAPSFFSTRARFSTDRRHSEHRQGSSSFPRA